MKRILLLTTPRTYRAEAFRQAAERLDIEVVEALDLPEALSEAWQVELGIDFSQPDEAVAAIVAFAEERPFSAIMAVDDSGALIAARAAQQLGLPHNDPTAAEAARNKHLMRQRLQAGDVPAPRSQRFLTQDDLGAIVEMVDFPVVVKPLTLNGSRGVIRANDAVELKTAVARTGQLLKQLFGNEEPHPFLVEDYVPGIEVAVEGLLDNGRLHILALFDKPDPLDGPYFEETIYVTPSRLPQETQEAIADCTVAAAKALGLQTGPVHAELRLNEMGPWVVEVAGRSIGGLCGQTLRFGVNASLEELILRQAVGLPLHSTQREGQASGVMMIPIPEAGLLRRIEGEETAVSGPLIERIEFTAKLNYPLVPLPDGDAYLGFIFARGETPEAVEQALREAHVALSFTIEPHIPLQII